MKVLVISHNAFSSSLNNGKTLESVFKDFPQDDISQLFFSQNESPDFNYCENYFKLTDIDVLKNLFSVSKKNGGELLCRNSKIIHSSMFAIAKKKSSYLPLFRDILWSFNSWKTKGLMKWLQYVNPDFIFFVGGNLGFSHKIAIRLSKILNKPLLVYFTDDYIIYPYNRSLLDVIQKCRLKSIYKRTVAHASLCFAIGDQMCIEYSEYFRKHFSPIMNMVDIADKKDYIENDIFKNVIIISYFGGLHLERWLMIAEIGRMIQNINQSSDYKKSIVLRVYTSSEITHEIEVAFGNDKIEVLPAIYGEYLLKEMSASSFLLHVESDDKYYRSLTRLSVSTKIPEYLLSSRCILAYGPSEVASMKLIADNDLGYVIYSEASEDVKTEMLSSAIFNAEEYFVKVSHANKYLRDNFNSVKIRKTFYEQISHVLRKI